MLDAWEIEERVLAYDAEGRFQVFRERVRHPRHERTHLFHTIDKPDFALVCALTDAREVVVTRQYRHGLRAVTLDVPGGMVDPGETPEEAARRELLEETGYDAPRWRSLGAFTVDANRGYGRAHLHLAEGARRVADPRSTTELEEIETILLPLDDALHRARAGAFGTLAPVACLALAATMLKQE